MKWDKLGLVYNPAGRGISWAFSHAYIPTPVLITQELIRVFVSFWDEKRVGRLGYVDVSAENPTKVLSVSKFPSLDVGAIGSFDCLGVTPMSTIVDSNDNIYLLYTGWGEHEHYPYTLFTGLAVSDNYGETFSKVLDIPILGPTKNESSIRTAAFIKYQPLEEEYWVWYVGGSEWFHADGKLTPTYDLKLLKIKNIYNLYEKEPIECMQADNKLNEYGIGRPCVIKENNIYKLFYSSRRYKHGYQLGYAESTDGVNWTRLDNQLGIAKSQIGWDSKMQCFSYILKTKYGTYMFYNGNDHGKQGFGVAKLDESSK